MDLIDHLLASEELSHRLLSIKILHDFAPKRALDPNRYSDHMPVLATFRLYDNI